MFVIVSKMNTAMFSARQRRYSLLLVWLAFGLVPAVLAHVKWFSDFSFLDPPRTFGAVLEPLVLGFAAFSAIAISTTVFLENRLEKWAIYQRVSNWLYERRDYSTLVLRIGMATTFLLSWQDSSLLAPYLPVADGWGWVQFLLAVLLIFPQTTPIAGLGTILLWFVGVVNFGTFYMLDYLAFLGIGTWLLLSEVKDVAVRNLGIPALYFTVGFSLAWLGMEKLVYPAWGIEILQANPQLTLGFPADFFLTGAAFVEFTLGYLLIIGLLGRPLGLVITLVFFTTTLVFGKVEVIGHTHLHAALIVFVLNGPGKFYPAPIDIHQRLNWRTAFAMVNFVLLLALFIGLYSIGAQGTYENALAETITDEYIAECNELREETDADEVGFIIAEGQALSCAMVLDYADGLDSATE